MSELPPPKTPPPMLMPMVFEEKLLPTMTLPVQGRVVETASWVKSVTVFCSILMPFPLPTMLLPSIRLSDEEINRMPRPPFCMKI